MNGPLAYAFWHRPSPGSEDGYEGRLSAFHAALAASPPPGLRGSWTWRVASPPWAPVGPAATVFLDWYVVDDLAALGHLADAAVTGERRGAHDEAARAAGPGAGGLYRLVAGAAGVPPDASTLAFADRERGVPWADVATGLSAGGASVWLRQLVLGPGPELASVAPAAGTDHPRLSVPGSSNHWVADARRVAP